MNRSGAHKNVSSMDLGGGTFLRALEVSSRLTATHTQIAEIMQAEFQSIQTSGPVPFAAISAKDAQQRLLDAIASSDADILLSKVLRNEVEALAFALSVELSAMFGLGSRHCAAFVKRCQERHEAEYASVNIDRSVWVLAAALTEYNDLPSPPIELRVHFNHSTQLTLLSDCAAPRTLQSALHYLHGLCWLAKGELAPGLIDTEFGTLLISLRNKVQGVQSHDGIVHIEIEKAIPDEASLLKTILPQFTPMPQNDTGKSFALVTDHLHLDVDVDDHTFISAHSSSSLLDRLEAAVEDSVHLFMSLSDPYGSGSSETFPIAVDIALAEFTKSPFPGLVISGSSGAGKTTAIKRWGCPR